MADEPAPTDQPQSLVELIDSLLALVTRLRRPNFLPPEQFAKLTEIDARIGAECQLHNIEIPRLDDPKSDVHYFGATRLPYAVRTRGGIIVASSTNWEQSMRVLRLARHPKVRVRYTRCERELQSVTSYLRSRELEQPGSELLRLDLSSLPRILQG